MKKKYEKEYHSVVHDHLYTDKRYYLARSKLSKIKYFNFLKDPKNLKILEFGCGLGQNIFLIENAQGYDISKFSLDFCEKNGIKILKDIKKLKNNSFDVILLCHVLEHLEKPYETILFLKNKLKKGGKIMLLLPPEKINKIKNFKPDIHQHLYCWNFRTIDNFLLRAGFKIIENKFIYGAAYKKLLFFNRIHFQLYRFATTALGKTLNFKEMMIIAQKE
jgi:SAM-dependent methyltransferase